MTKIDRLTALVPRITAVAAAAFAVLHVYLAAATEAHISAAVVAVLSGLLAWGTWRGKRGALKAATALFVLLAILIPLGLLNPFRAMDLAPATREAPGFVARTIALAAVSVIVSLAFAFFLGRAARKAGQPPA